MIEGLFIAIEGVDGAGTTTHTKLLKRGLSARGLPVHTTREPSDGPIGTMIRQMLSGRLIVPTMHGGMKAPGWSTMALLFAADRLDHLEAEIVPNLMDGVTVLTDRYDHSSIAYQSITGGGAQDTIAWVEALNKYARRPDLTIVLDVPPDIARQRRMDRSGKREIFDDDQLQERLTKFYLEIDAYFPNDTIVHIDGSGSLEETERAIMNAVREARGEPAL